MSDEQAVRSPSEIEQATPSEDRLIGSVIDGKYRVVKRLGHGGMGAVYKAEHLLIDRTVAIKMLHAYLAESPEYLSRFKREASIASKLSHPNAITLFDYGIENNSPFLVMQYVEGRTLQSILKTEGPITPARAAHLLSQIGESLDEAHRLGIVHRDLKPDNVMVANRADGTETVWVLDFGIAKPLNDKNDSLTSNLTQVGMFMGTPQYMSPEQALMNEIDARSDIYSLGIIAYEMLTGKVPFSCKSPVELLFKHVNEMPIPLREFPPGDTVPRAVSDAVMKALAKDPKERYQKVGDFIHAFSKAANETVSSAGVKRSPSWNWRIVSGAVASIILLSLVYLLRSGQDTPSPTAENQAPQNTLEQLDKPVTATPLVISRNEDTTAPADHIAKASSSDSAPPPAAIDPVALESSVQESATEVVDESSTIGSVKAVPEMPSQVTVEQDNSEIATVVSAPQHEELDEKTAKAKLTTAYSEGQRLFEEKQYIRAGLKFREALSIEPDHLRSLLSLGVCLLRLGYPAQAKERFDTALEVNPNYAPTLYNIASYYAYMGDIDGTIKYLEQATKLYPKIKTWLQNDPDFEKVRNSNEFQKFLG